MTAFRNTNTDAVVIDRPIYFHIGYPKTATTTLQRHVFADLPGVKYIGKWADGTKRNFVTGEVDDAIRDFVLLPETQYTEGSLSAAILESFVENSVHSHGTLLVSHEGIANPFYGNVAIKANRMSREFPNARVIIVVRSQIDLLRSWYEMRPATPLGPGTGCKPLSFDAWTEHALRYEFRSPLPFLRYDEVARYYAGLLGSDQVLVLLFEWLQRDPTLFFDKLGRFIGADPGMMMQLMAKRRENTATDHRIRHSALARTKAAVFPNVSFRRVLPSWLYDAILSYVGRTRRRPTLKPELISRLSEYYGKSNRSLSELLGTDVSALGYLTEQTRTPAE